MSIEPAVTRVVDAIVPRVAGAVAEDAAHAASGRPISAMVKLSVEAGEHGFPRHDVPALASIQQTFRIAPSAEQGIVELRLPSAQTAVLRAHAGSGGQAITGSVEGDLLRLQLPAGTDRFSLDTAVASTPDGPLQLRYDRLHMADLTARIERGAEAVGQPANFRTGIVPPDERGVLVSIAERGWELTESSLPRDRPDYVHPLTESLQASFEGPRDQAFTATAEYTGRVNGHASEGTIADVRRGAKRAYQGIGGLLVHLHEGLGH
jgi:hypothetical protein